MADEQTTPYKFAFFLALNVAFFSWLAMLALGSIWHMFDVGQPISFWQSLPLGAGILLGVFLYGRQR